MEAEGRRIGSRYVQILQRINKGGAGYPVDTLLRALATEYTHRYATSGTATQPVSFNYFESFCAIRLIEKSTAPYAAPREEHNHLFNVPDYFDYLTSAEKVAFENVDLQNLAEGEVHHFTQNGTVTDFTYLNSRGKEFVISGFSMIRHGNSLHWYMLGGEVLSESELKDLTENDRELEITEAPEPKRKFLEEVMRERGSRSGPPVLLAGTKTAVRTIIVGEFDLVASKHVARCYMTETENSFNLISDDPDIFYYEADTEKRDKILSNMQSQLEKASVMWDLAEGFFQLPSYFQFRLTISGEVVKASGLPKPKGTKAGRGVGAEFKQVASLEISDAKSSLLISYIPPPFEMETEGYWHRLDRDVYGTDREGNSVRGRDWVRADIEWRRRENDPNTIFIKSSVNSAKIAISDYLKAAEEVEKNPRKGELEVGVLYVMRCMAMNDEVYKVGWTSRTAEERAKELSTTGVPVPFEVVECWKHGDPSALERGVHALLDPYRIKGNREFFKVGYPELKALIEQEIARTKAVGSS
jgi:hypothetical protein